MKFYRVNNDYIAYLRQHDEHVSYNKQRRPYVGIILEFPNNDHKYLAPLSSKNPNYNNETIFQIHEKNAPNAKLGVLHLNNMIPVLPSEITHIDFSNEELHYKILLEKQYLFIKSKQEDIMEQAQKMYNHVTVHNNQFFCKISCDFSKLESIYKNYKIDTTK